MRTAKTVCKPCWKLWRRRKKRRARGFAADSSALFCPFARRFARLSAPKLSDAKIRNRVVFFCSRRHENVTEGFVPNCLKSQHSQLVEVVTCRKCGYLFGALQDLGPRRAKIQTTTMKKRTASRFFQNGTRMGGRFFLVVFQRRTRFAFSAAND